MPSGAIISADLRQIIADRVVGNQEVPDKAYQAIFSGNSSVYTKRSFANLVCRLRSMTAEQIRHYIEAGRISGRPFAGRKKVHLSGVRGVLWNIRLSYAASRLCDVATIYKDNHALPGGPVPSVSYLSKMMSKESKGIQLLKQKHELMDPVARMEYLEQMRLINPNNLIDVSATVCTEAENEAQYGWVRHHIPAYGTQFQLGGNSYSAIAAYSVEGFLAWTICKGTMTAAEVAHFLEDKLHSAMDPVSMVIIDQAIIRKAEAVLGTVAEVTGSKYTIAPEYSPDFRPIELGFADVQQFLCAHEAEAVLDPMVWINRAFEHHSRHGEGRHTARKNWTLYEALYRMHQEQMAT